MGTTRSRVWLVVAAMLVGLLPASVEAGTAGKTVRFTGLEKCFMQRINDYRRANGLRPLGSDRHLGYVARRHARSLARRDALEHDHNYGREITNWKRLGQNTGRGESCGALVRAFWASKTHRRNILGTWRFHAVGVAQRNGKIHIQHIFESRRDPGNIY